LYFHVAHLIGQSQRKACVHQPHQESTMPRTVVFTRPTLLPSIFREPSSFTAKNSGRITLNAIDVDKDRHA
jgi:hypothetical protein